uniref:Deacetylase sirtuin-type domain-containing protein n=1 Tax=Rhodosorus marinus TaxID=101924 RepID=A0A7S0BJ36_9RHOD|mmetsp:Transcript_17615/g.25335  ORF Transcript_17615/g.25335 Transcript_17615/m.25335 type:complete len:584 (+) Transcript_17615:943-2694(+)
MGMSNETLEQTLQESGAEDTLNLWKEYGDKESPSVFLVSPESWTAKETKLSVASDTNQVPLSFSGKLSTKRPLEESDEVTSSPKQSRLDDEVEAGILDEESLSEAHKLSGEELIHLPVESGTRSQQVLMEGDEEELDEYELLHELVLRNGRGDDHGTGEESGEEPEIGEEQRVGEEPDEEEEDDDDDSSSYSSFEEEVEIVMERMQAEIGQSKEGKHFSLNDFLKKHDVDSELLTSLSASGQLSLGALCRALVAYDRARGGKSFLPERELVVEVQNFSSVVDLIQKSKKILVLTGAGVSVSCGIPDFRSPGGLYDTVRDRFGLEEPQALFDINFFKFNPNPFFTLAKDIFPGGNVTPSLAHRFVRKIEMNGQLLRNYTQNIDGLEKMSGIEKVIHCHGSFATATCRRCQNQVPGESIREEVLAETIPVCTVCRDRPVEQGEEKPILKPDIVFFGEKLVNAFFDNVNADIENADLMIVMGTSLKVAPVARLPSLLDTKVPRILINRELVGSSSQRFDVELLGNCDDVVKVLMERLDDATHVTERDESEKFSREGTNRFVFGAMQKSVPDGGKVKAATEQVATVE